jgi:hypothetical protein
MPAKRGDLAVIIIERQDYYIGQASPPARTEVTIHEVTSVTRDGAVKAVRGTWPGSSPVPVERLARGARILTMSKTAIDVPAALDVARAHHWAGHPGQPRPFDSLAAVRAALQACRIHPAAA